MQPLRTEDLVRLLEIMRSMQDVVAEANWQELARLDSERRALLKYDPSGAPHVENNQVPARVSSGLLAHTGNVRKDHSGSELQKESLIAEIRQLDELIISTVQSARQRLLDENRGLSSQMKAKQLYAMTSSMS